MITLEQIANWNSQQNPLEKVLGQNSVSPCVTARGAGEDHSGMILYCDELKETTNLRSNYMQDKEIEVADGKVMNFKKDDVCGTLLTNGNFTGAGVQLIKIWDGFNNKALNETLKANDVDDGDFIDAYNRVVKKDIAGTIKTTINTSNMTFVADGKTQGNDINLSPTLDTASGGHRQPLIWDGFNQQIRADQTCIGTITRQVGADLKRNGQGVIEYIPLDEQNGYLRKDTSYVGQSGLIQPIDRNYKEHGVDREEHIEWKNDNTSHALRTSVIPVTTNKSYRIRKLTPKECGRLMGVKDDDIDKMSVNQSNSKLYHLYGDSIVVDVLMEIFSQMI